MARIHFPKVVLQTTSRLVELGYHPETNGKGDVTFSKKIVNGVVCDILIHQLPYTSPRHHPPGQFGVTIRRVRFPECTEPEGLYSWAMAELMFFLEYVPDSLTQ